MSKRINFYNVGVYYNGEKTNIDFMQLLDSIEEIRWENRVRNINGDLSAMFPFHYITNRREIRIVPVGKFRKDYKPYIGHTSTPRLREIESSVDVVELSTFVYDQSYRMLVLEYSTYGLKERAIEEYFSSFLPIGNSNDYAVKLTPMTTENLREKIERTNQIKFIEIKFKLDNFSRNIVTVQRENSNILDLLDNINVETDNLDANVVTLEFKVEGGNSATMDIRSAIELLNTLNIDHESIDSVKVRYRDNSVDKLDTMDLKETDIKLRSRIFNNEVGNPGPEYIGLKIVDEIDSYTATLLNNYSRFIEGMISKELPPLQVVPRLENQILD